MKTRYFVDEQGNYIGGFGGCVVQREVVKTIPGKKLRTQAVLEDVEFFPEIPAGAIEISAPPEHGWQKYDLVNEEWLPLTDDQNARL